MYKRYDNIKPHISPAAPPSSPPPPKLSLKNDDLLLLGIIFLVIKEGRGNNLLIFALIFIFLSGFSENA